MSHYVALYSFGLKVVSLKFKLFLEMFSEAELLKVIVSIFGSYVCVIPLISVPNIIYFHDSGMNDFAQEGIFFYFWQALNQL